MINMVKLPTNKSSLFLRVAKEIGRASCRERV